MRGRNTPLYSGQRTIEMPRSCILIKNHLCQRTRGQISIIILIGASAETCIRWVPLAWADMTADTMLKCSRKAGIIQGEDMEVVARPHNDGVDPFAEGDDENELQDLTA